jgi:hypothetical protein
MANVGWMEAMMMTGIVAVLVVLVTLVVLAARTAAQSSARDLLLPGPDD